MQCRRCLHWHTLRFLNFNEAGENRSKQLSGLSLYCCISMPSSTTTTTTWKRAAQKHLYSVYACNNEIAALSVWPWWLWPTRHRRTSAAPGPCIKCFLRWYRFFIKRKKKDRASNDARTSKLQKVFCPTVSDPFLFSFQQFSPHLLWQQGYGRWCKKKLLAHGGLLLRVGSLLLVHEFNSSCTSVVN